MQLRGKGYSYTYIQEKTKLSKSTLSHLLRYVPYVPNEYTKKTIGRALAKSGESKAKSKRDSLVSARKNADNDLGRITERDIFMLGIGLYIGEGSKTQDLVRLVNADPKVVRLFIKWLASLGYPIENLSIRIHLYPNSDITRAETYWRQETKLSATQFQSACIDRRAGKNRRRSGTHKNGTAHVTVRSCGNKNFGVNFSRRISAWMEKVLECSS